MFAIPPRQRLQSMCSLPFVVERFGAWILSASLIQLISHSNLVTSGGPHHDMPWTLSKAEMVVATLLAFLVMAWDGVPKMVATEEEL